MALVADAARWAGKLGGQDAGERYRALADIERGFRVLKSEIEIAPVYHRLPERIRAHALICFLALVLYRVLRMLTHNQPLTLKSVELGPPRPLPARQAVDDGQGRNGYSIN